jgi:hypothetical protein
LRSRLLGGVLPLGLMLATVVGGASAASATGPGPSARGGSSPTGGFQNYLAGAMAPVYQMTEDAPNAQFHPQGEGEFDYSLATMTKATAYALSALVWPGSAAGNAGTLLSVLGVPGQTGALNDPARAEATSGSPDTSQNIGGPGGAAMAATVVPPQPGQQSAQARTTSGGGGLGPAGTTGAASSEGRIVLDPASGSLTTSATSAASDVGLDGGLVTIASFSSDARATSVSGGPVVTSGSTQVSGLQVAGQAAYLDGSGVHLGRPGHSAPPAEQSAVDSILSQAGMSIYFTDPHSVPIGGVEYYVAGSVLFYWPAPHDPNGDSFTLSLGGAAVSLGVTAAGASRGGAGSTAPAQNGPPAPTPATASLSLPLPPTSLSLPADSVGAGISADLGRIPAERTVAAVSGPGLPGGVGPWWLLILMAGLAGALGLPRLAGLLGRGSTPPCPLERKEETL